MAVLFSLLIGCTSTKTMVQPPVEIVTTPPGVESIPSPPIGPPPGYVKPENYWVREKIILTSEPEPQASATQKSAVKKGKQSKKTG
jgi:hypothetical protein